MTNFTAETEITDLGFTSTGKHLFHVKAEVDEATSGGSSTVTISVPCYTIHNIVPSAIPATDITTVKIHGDEDAEDLGSNEIVLTPAAACTVYILVVGT